MKTIVRISIIGASSLLVVGSASFAGYSTYREIRNLKNDNTSLRSQLITGAQKAGSVSKELEQIKANNPCLGLSAGCVTLATATPTVVSAPTPTPKPTIQATASPQAQVTPTPATQYVHYSGKVFSYDYPSNAVVPAYDSSSGYFQIGTKIYNVTNIGALKTQNVTDIEGYITKAGISKSLSDYTQSTVSGVAAYTTKKELLTYLALNGSVYIIEVHDGGIPSQDMIDAAYQRLLTSLVITP